MAQNLHARNIHVHSDAQEAGEDQSPGLVLIV